MNENNLLVTLATEDYIDQAKQLFASAYFQGRWTGDMMLLAYRIPEKRLVEFRNKGILVKKINPLSVKSKYPIGSYGSITFSKFYLFTPEFKRWRKILYLDADIIIRKSLQVITLKDKYLYATRIYAIESLFNDDDKELFNTLDNNFNLKHLAFNAGVMLIPSSLIKDSDFNKIMDLFVKYIDISKGHDESILNLYFLNSWRRLSLLFNFYVRTFVRTLGRSPAKLDACVLHFCDLADGKPWQAGNYFYKEWSNNLVMFNRIGDQALRVNQADRLAILKIKFFFLVYLPFLGYDLYKSWQCSWDQRIGRLGSVIKQRSPLLYLVLKKVINRR